jgi:hypothetical protein
VAGGLVDMKAAAAGVTADAVTVTMAGVTDVRPFTLMTT